MLLSSLFFILVISIFLIWGTTFNENRKNFKSLIVSFLKRRFISVKKHFSLVNLITGVMCLILIVCIKQSGLSLFILSLLKEYVPNIPQGSEYFLASFIGLICRLGLKGLIEDGFKEVFPTYNAMTGGGDINPTESNNSGGKDNTSGGSSSTGVQKESLSDKGKNPEIAGDSTKSSEYVKGNFTAKRYATLWDKEAQRINAEIKALSSEISNCKDEEEKAFKEEDLDELFEQLSMMSKESAIENRKISSTNSQSSNKRTADSTVDLDSSKKRS